MSIHKEITALRQELLELKKEVRREKSRRKNRYLLWVMATLLLLTMPLLGASIMNGSLGIGITSPGAKLHIVQTAVANALRVDDANGDTTPFVIDANGNVGIQDATPIQTLDINGRMQVANGVIQRGGAALTTTSDLGLYSQNGGSWLRLVTNNGPINFYQDSGIGTNAVVSFGTSFLSFNQESRFIGTTHTSYINSGGAENSYLRAGTTGGSVYLNDSHNGDVYLGSGGGRIRMSPLSGFYIEDPGMALGSRKFVSFETNASIAQTYRVHLNAPDNYGANQPAITLEGHNFAGGGYVGINTPDPSGAFNFEVTGSAAKTGGGSWSTLSDRRKKKKIRPLQNALSTVLKLRGVSYFWRNPAAHGNQEAKQRGFIAQEVEKVFPDWVLQDNQGFRWLNTSGIEALIVEALRELKKQHANQIKHLKKQNEILRQQLLDIKTQIRYSRSNLENLAGEAPLEEGETR